MLRARGAQRPNAPSHLGERLPGGLRRQNGAWERAAAIIVPSPGAI